MFKLIKMDKSDYFIDKIITNLKIISMIQINEKLCLRSGHLQIDPNTFGLQFLKRWFYKDSREIIIPFIKEILKSAKILLENGFVIVLKELKQVPMGLSNLKTTYSHDPITMVMIENIINKVNLVIEKYQQGYTNQGFLDLSI
jgi:nitrogen fixation protein